MPHPKTIVEVNGDKYNGFGIHHYDGSADFPPTNSEARAECSEYDTRVAGCGAVPRSGSGTATSAT